MVSELARRGYSVLQEVYSPNEIDQLIKLIDEKAISDEFGVREFLNIHPDIASLVFNTQLKSIIKEISPNCDKSIKSIFFNKPSSANWVVNWHQDLTINLKEKKEGTPFQFKRINSERAVVQPGVNFLENIFTIRIHLDDCDVGNGALRVVENSHQQGVINLEEYLKGEKDLNEKVCEVKGGGILIMRPLILHSSRRTENDRNRRVIHIEFTDQELPDRLTWKESIIF